GLTEKEGHELMRLLRKAIAAGNELSRAPLREATMADEADRPCQAFNDLASVRRPRRRPRLRRPGERRAEAPPPSRRHDRRGAETCGSRTYAKTSAKPRTKSCRRLARHRLAQAYFDASPFLDVAGRALERQRLVGIHKLCAGQRNQLVRREKRALSQHAHD